MVDFFYDNQVRRYLLQFMRIFSELQYKHGPDANGNYILSRIPVIYGDMSRMVAQIITGNTENIAMTSPSMAVKIVGLELAPERRNDPMWISKKQVAERSFDAATQTYGSEIGNRYSVERYMPVPYTLTFQLDLMTTLTDVKLQILEQILTIFNPSVQLQQTDNPLDWSSVFEVELTNINWSNRSIPVGESTEHDFASLTFTLPIWINPPARVMRQRIIEKIVTRVWAGTIDRKADDIFASLSLVKQFTFASDDLMIDVKPYTIAGYSEVQLLHKYGVGSDDLTWDSIVETYGKVEVGTTKLKLRTNSNLDIESGDIYGAVTPHPSDPTKLIFQADIDTMPVTISGGPIDRLIDPTFMWPGHGLPAAVEGQRYLLSGTETGGDEPAIISGQVGHPNYWGNLIAYENDIITYHSGAWAVSFDSRTENAEQQVVNKEDGEHYRFDGRDWVYSYLGRYNPAYWSLENLVGNN
jgi:hypothetical protein